MPTATTVTPTPPPSPGLPLQMGPPPRPLPPVITHALTLLPPKQPQCTHFCHLPVPALAQPLPPSPGPPKASRPHPGCPSSPSLLALQGPPAVVPSQDTLRSALPVLTPAASGASSSPPPGARSHSPPFAALVVTRLTRSLLCCLYLICLFNGIMGQTRVHTKPMC